MANGCVPEGYFENPLDLVFSRSDLALFYLGRCMHCKNLYNEETDTKCPILENMIDPNTGIISSEYVTKFTKKDESVKGAQVLFFCQNYKSKKD